MKKINIKIILALALLASVGCMKERIIHEYPIGSLVQLHNITIPGIEPPLRIDSVYYRGKEATTYWVTDMNGRVLKNLSDYQIRPWLSN